MILKSWKLVAITVLSLLAFLMSALLMSTYDMTYWMFTSPSYLWMSCDCEDMCSGSAPSELTKNESVQLDDIPMRKLYDKLVKTRTGRRGGTMMNIAVLSAFKHPDQIYVLITSDAKYGDTIYCRYFDHQRKEIGPAFKTIVFPEFTANCLLREGVQYMSLTDSATGSYEFPVPIIDRTQNSTTHFFSVCLAPLYGTEPKWLLLAEFIEHHKIQGVTYFYIYVNKMDDYSRKLLDDYVRTGEAEIISVHDPFIGKPVQWQWPALQDCLIRSRGHSRWMTPIDLDERMTPTEYSGTLIDFLQNISDPTIAELSFRQQWVLRNETTPEKIVDKKQIVELMPTWRYHNTSGVAEIFYCSKYIIDPKKVISAAVHTADTFFDGYTRSMVKPEEAVIRHYRDVYAGDWGRYSLKDLRKFGEFSMTDYPERNMMTLRENVLHRLHHVYGGLL